MRYAYFAGPRRLAVEVNGQVTLYDTLDHQIGGVAQQQGKEGSLTFTSQHGTVDLAQLPVLSAEGRQAANPVPIAHPVSPASEGDLFHKLERLAELRKDGVLTEEEFAAKKAELLRRI